MESSNGRLSFAASIDNSRLRSDAAESRNILASIGQTATAQGAGMDATFRRIGATIGSVFAVDQMRRFVAQCIETRGHIQSMEVAFRTLLGNKQQADAMFNSIRQFAVSTPMLMGDLAAGAQQMLAFGIEADKVMPMLRALGDVSMGDSQKFQSLTLAFSQMSATGKLMGQDLLQMINAGFNPLQQISERTGKSIGELKDEMSSGSISAEMVQQAFLDATSAGGKFHNMLQNMSGGVEGQISNLQGAIEDMMSGIGGSLEGATTTAISEATYLVQHYQEVADVLVGVVGAYGVYKAAVIANEAAIRAAEDLRLKGVQAAFDQEMTALTELLPKKEAEAMTSLQQAVASGQLTEAKAQEIAALRASAAEYVEQLEATEEAALGRLTNAQQEVAVYAQWQDELRDRISGLEEEAEALFEAGDSAGFEATQQEIAAAKKELASVATEHQAAVTDVQTAAEEMNTAAHQRNAVAQVEDTAATTANTSATTANTGATALLTKAKTSLTTAATKATAALAAHPYALAAAAVAALAYGVYKLATYETEAEKATKAAIEAGKRANAEYLAETQNLEVLKNRLANVKKGSQEWVEIKDAIVSQYGKYMDNLDAEITKVGNLSSAYIELTKQIRIAATARAMDDWKKENDHFESKQTDLEEIRKALMGTKGYKEGLFNLEQRMATISSIMDNPNEPASQYEKTLRDYLRNVRTDGGETAWSRIRRQQIFKQREQNAIAEIGARNGFGQDDAARISIGLAPAKQEKETELWQKDVAAARKKLADAQAEVKKLKADASSSTKAVKEAQAKVDAAEKALKDLGVDLTSERKAGSVSAENAQTLADEASEREKQMEDYKKDLAKSAADTELEIQQQRIDAMHEGSDKAIAQAKLDYARTMAELKERERAMLDALAEQRIIEQEQADPTAFKRKNSSGKWEDDPAKRAKALEQAKSDVTLADLTEDQQKAILELQHIAKLQYTKAVNEAYEAEYAAMDENLQRYGTYQEKKLAIQEEYARRISEAGSEQEQFSLQRERDAAVGSLEAERMRESINWQAVFGNFGGMFSDVVRASLADVKAYMQTDSFKNSDQASQQALISAVAEMEREVGTTTTGFGKLSRDMEEYQAALQRNKIAQAMNEASFKNLRSAQEKYRKAVESGSVADINAARQAVEAAQLQYDAASNSAHATEEAANVARTTVTNTASSLQASMENVVGGLQSLKGSSLSGIFDGVKSLTKGIGALSKAPDDFAAVINKVSDKLEGVPVVGWILSIIDLLKDGLDELISGLIDAVFNAVGGILSDVLSGDMVMNIGKSLVNGVGKIVEAFSFGSLAGNADDVAETTERLTKQNELLQRSVDELRKSIDKNYGGKSIEAYNEAVKKLNAQIANQREILYEQNREWGSGHHSNEHEWNIPQSGVDAINRMLGTRLESTTFAPWMNLSPEQMNRIRTERPDIWTYMLTSGPNDKSSYWNAFADLAGKKEELKEQLYANLTGVTFEGLRDSFIDTLMDMSKSAEDFSDNFSEMLQRALLQGMISDKFDDQIKKFYLDLNKDLIGSDNKFNTLSDWQINRYRERWDAMVKDMMTERDLLAEITGYDDTQSNREASKRGIATASQDSVDELNGRATAIQGHTYSIAENTKLMLETTQGILASVMHIESETDGMSERLEGIERGVDNMADVLELITTKGIRLKN